jgi:phosphoglucosamine mutase
MINVRVEGKIDLLDKRITSAIGEAEKDLAGAGRVLLRPSGTEPVVRVMVEGEDLQLVNRLAKSLSEVVSEVCV